MVVRRAAFPTWRVTADGREIRQTGGPLIAFDVVPGPYRIVRQPPAVERLASAVSGAALSLFALLTLAAYLVRHRTGAIARRPVSDAARR